LHIICTRTQTNLDGNLKSVERNDDERERVFCRLFSPTIKQQVKCGGAIFFCCLFLRLVDRVGENKT
jgi:hypothetical protein